MGNNSLSKAFDKAKLRLVDSTRSTTPYQYRDLNPDYISEEDLWSIEGRDLLTDKVGVLEWRDGEQDATNCLKRMATFSQFINLKKVPYLDTDYKTVKAVVPPIATIPQTKVWATTTTFDDNVTKPTIHERIRYYLKWLESLETSVFKDYSDNLRYTMLASGYTLSELCLLLKLDINQSRQLLSVYKGTTKPELLTYETTLAIHKLSTPRIRAFGELMSYYHTVYIPEMAKLSD